MQVLLVKQEKLVLILLCISGLVKGLRAVSVAVLTVDKRTGYIKDQTNISVLYSHGKGVPVCGRGSDQTIISLHVLPTFFVKQDAIICLHGQVALFAQSGSWTWCSPGPPCPYLQRGFPASWPPAWPGVWDYFSPGAGFGISFCRNFMTSCKHISPACRGITG